MFPSLAQFYRAQADSKAGNHGDALARLILAESLAKEANRSASSFSTAFLHVSQTLPADAGSSILELTKFHLQLCTERKNEAQRENDLIYNAIVPSAEVLSHIEKASVATPISIQEVYGSPDVQKIIGPDIFLRLIPLSVHESASVYSEEKAKLIRKEVEDVESAEVEARSALEAMGIPGGLERFKAITDDHAEDNVIPLDVRRWIEDIGVIEGREGVETLLRELARLKEGVRSELDGISRELEAESHECEAMRIKYDHIWTQEPSTGLNKSLRQDLKSHVAAFDAAASSDQQVATLWDSIKGDILLLLSPGIEEMFRASAQPGDPSQSLLDLDVGHDEQERAKIGQFTSEIEERLGRVKKISYERNEVLKDLKEKVSIRSQCLVIICSYHPSSKPMMFPIFFYSTVAILGSSLRYSQLNWKNLNHTNNDLLLPSIISKLFCKKSRTCGRPFATLLGVGQGRRNGKNKKRGRRKLYVVFLELEMGTWTSVMV